MKNSIHTKRYATVAMLCTIAVGFAVIAIDNEAGKWIATLWGGLITWMCCSGVIPYHEDGSK